MGEPLNEALERLEVITHRKEDDYFVAELAPMTIDEAIEVIDAARTHARVCLGEPSDEEVKELLEAWRGLYGAKGQAPAPNKASALFLLQRVRRVRESTEVKRTLVTINGIEHMWTDTERVTYEEIVRAAYPGADVSGVWTVTYRFRCSGGLGGSLKGPGDSIGLVDDMAFNVADTSNA